MNPNLILLNQRAAVVIIPAGLKGCPGGVYPAVNPKNFGGSKIRGCITHSTDCADNSGNLNTPGAITPEKNTTTGARSAVSAITTAPTIMYTRSITVRANTAATSTTRRCTPASATCTARPTGRGYTGTGIPRTGSPARINCA
ncbi:hypothetical protein [Dethiosulfatarculus sandiegensis]|uniref:hypothetical protein n=1 Tax=Dethiosulfatarculus sandiegensis TaxID=1429043 RepID=UPI0012E21061|nr:hypothetical protein [Dethiosulfatarculus sandiegensis]